MKVKTTTEITFESPAEIRELIRYEAIFEGIDATFKERKRYATGRTYRIIQTEYLPASEFMKGLKKDD